MKERIKYWIDNYNKFGDIKILLDGEEACLIKDKGFFWLLSNNAQFNGRNKEDKKGFSNSWILSTNNDYDINGIDFLNNEINSVKISCEILLQPYGSGKNKSYHKALAKDIRVGFEIERSTLLEYEQGEELLKNKWTLEKDYTASGGEYISPILDIEEAENFINRFDYLLGDKKDDSCGGHIHVSVKGMTSNNLYSQLKYYRPILWGIYPKRALNSYSSKYNNCREHSVDVGIRSKTVEFRIFPQLRTKEQLKFRLALLKFFIINKVNSKEEALNILNKKSIDFISILDIIYKTIDKKINVIKRILKAYELNMEDENNIEKYLIKICENLNK